jgi:hypothetical protein
MDDVGIRLSCVHISLDNSVAIEMRSAGRCMVRWRLTRLSMIRLSEQDGPVFLMLIGS